MGLLQFEFSRTKALRILRETNLEPHLGRGNGITLEQTHLPGSLIGEKRDLKESQMILESELRRNHKAEIEGSWEEKFG